MAILDPLSRAIELAVWAHHGQLDKGGQPYILHALRVMLAMSTEEERIVAVLHDAIEDGPGDSRSRIKTSGFSDAVLAALDAVTRRSDETYRAYIARLSGNALARRVKLADLADNLDARRALPPTSTLKSRYGRALEALKALDSLAVHHDHPPVELAP